MKRLSLTLLLGLTMLLPTLAAQHTIGTAFGQTLQGTLLSDDGSTITFRTDGGTEMKLPYKELDAQTIFRLMDAKTAKTDGPGQLRLGDQAAAAELFDEARDAYALAVKDDPSLRTQVDVKLATLRLAASDSLLAKAKHASEHNRPDVALHDLAILMHEFPDEPAAKEGSALYDTLSTSQAAARSKAKAQEQSQAVQQALAPAEASYAAIGNKIKQGLQSSANQTVAIDAFNSAIQMGKTARTSLHELQGRESTIEGLAPAIQQLDQELEDQIVDAYTQLANVYNVRTSYQDANTAVNSALALQPNNQDLLQLRQQITSNAAEGGSNVAVGGVVGWRVLR